MKLNCRRSYNDFNKIYERVITLNFVESPQ